MASEENRASQSDEVSLQKKYGGIPSKKPLISKDHEHAYFDSADWVLDKQGVSNDAKSTAELLKPKLQRTPYHQLPPRRPACRSDGAE